MIDASVGGSTPKHKGTYMWPHVFAFLASTAAVPRIRVLRAVSVCVCVSPLWLVSLLRWLHGRQTDSPFLASRPELFLTTAVVVAEHDCCCWFFVSTDAGADQPLYDCLHQHQVLLLRTDRHGEVFAKDGVSDWLFAENWFITVMYSCGVCV